MHLVVQQICTIFFFELKYVVCSKHLTESAKQQAA